MSGLAASISVFLSLSAGWTTRVASFFRAFPNFETPDSSWLITQFDACCIVSLIA